MKKTISERIIEKEKTSSENITKPKEALKEAKGEEEGEDQEPESGSISRSIISNEELYSDSFSEPFTEYTSKIDIIFPKEEIINEGYTTDKSMKRINKFITYVSNSICKLNIDINDEDKEGMGTGFLIKIKNNINNKTNYKYFLITCEHVIKREYIESENTEIEINYHSRAIKLKINLDKYERMIRTYEDIIDITLIEILKEDDINENFF